MQLSHSKKMFFSDMALLFVAIVWGGGFIAVKEALKTLSPMLLMAFRFTIASALLYVFFYKKIGKISLSDIKGGGTVGVVLFLAFAFQTYGLEHTTASKQGFLTAVYVVFVPVLYWFFYKKAPSLKVFIASALALIGIGFISYQVNMTINPGDLLTLVCALFFALHILSIEYFSKTLSSIKLAFIQMSTCAGLCIVAAILTEPARLSLSIREWSLVIYLALFSTFLCFTVQTIAQKYTSSSHASLIMSLESVFAAFLGVWLLGEVMTKRILIGSALLFLAIIIVEVNFSMFSRKKLIHKK